MWWIQIIQPSKQAAISIGDQTDRLSISRDQTQGQVSPIYTRGDGLTAPGMAFLGVETGTAKRGRPKDPRRKIQESRVKKSTVNLNAGPSQDGVKREFMQRLA